MKKVQPELFDISFNQVGESDKSLLPYYWVSEDNRFALWFIEEHHQWIVGELKNRYIFIEVLTCEFACVGDYLRYSI